MSAPVPCLPSGTPAATRPTCCSNVVPEALARELRSEGVAIDHVDLGGGLGVSYDGSPVPAATDYAAALLPAVTGSGLKLLLEPGRNIMAPAGALLSRVIDVKE